MFQRLIKKSEKHALVLLREWFWWNNVRTRWFYKSQPESFNFIIYHKQFSWERFTWWLNQIKIDGISLKNRIAQKIIIFCFQLIFLFSPISNSVVCPKLFKEILIVETGTLKSILKKTRKHYALQQSRWFAPT